MQQLGKYIIIAGIILIICGMILYFFHDKLQFIGKLPGDINIRKPGYQFYFPITTMLLVSVAISLIIYLIRTFISR